MSQASSSPDALTRTDAVVIGAGAAGLSLLTHLGRAGWRGTVAIIEDGSLPLDERSWAWWSTGEGPLDGDATAEFSHAIVAGSGWQRTLALEPYAYRTITGAALRAAATRPRESVNAVTWIDGAATGVRAHPEGVEIEVRTPTGSSVLVRASTVFDSVGLDTSAHAWTPHLDFLGWQITADRDIFAPDTLTLMDFRTDQSHGVAFVYVLPTSARSALVERTVFVTAHDTSATDHAPHLRGYVREVLGIDSFDAVETERGAIPLGATRSRPRVPGLTPIGTPAGAVKASTGYAFARIQAHCARLTEVMTGGGEAASGPESSRWYAGLDHALLTLLREDPDGGRRILETLLRRASPEEILQFLDEDLPSGAQARVGARLPFWLFGRAYCRALVGRAHKPSRL